jgi:hypothetical protein
MNLCARTIASCLPLSRRASGSLRLSFESVLRPALAVATAVRRSVDGDRPHARPPLSVLSDPLGFRAADGNDALARCRRLPERPSATPVVVRERHDVLDSWTGYAAAAGVVRRRSNSRTT